ncbi:MAG TPA: Druantia anti-phage system protein DruA [Solirubrobacterales bacterium]|nr:Druantia anti-phage system protein DruA [Solirubrobacterales bacterium]
MEVNDKILKSRSRMRAAVIDSLTQQGFTLSKGKIVAPSMDSKESLRALHREAVDHQREKSRPGLERHERTLLRSIANGNDLDPSKVRPRLIQVHPGTEEELLFRWARLHWSIPTSAGYGRRLRFLVRDEAHHDRLIGIIGLSDPVFALRGRDDWIGWDKEARRERLHQVMDAFVLGAVPPYNMLLAGKLVALLATSSEVQNAYALRYCDRTSLISSKRRTAPLALLTTASALGRSSVYSRLRLPGRKVAIGVGFTRGSGDFQFANGLYDALSAYAAKNCTPTAKNSDWGSGFRNRREVVKKALQHLGLSDALMYHGVEREIFVFPLGEDTREALTNGSELSPYPESVEYMAAFWKLRWLLPRAVRDDRYKSFHRDSWRLWT